MQINNALDADPIGTPVDVLQNDKVLAALARLYVVAFTAC